MLASAAIASAQNYIRSPASASVVGLTLTNATAGTNAAQSLGGFQLGYGGSGTVDLASRVVVHSTNVASVIYTLALADDPDGLGYADATVTVTNVPAITDGAATLSTNVFSVPISTGQHRWIKFTDVKVVKGGGAGPVSVTVDAKFGQHRP